MPLHPQKQLALGSTCFRQQLASCRGIRDDRSGEDQGSEGDDAFLLDELSRRIQDVEAAKAKSVEVLAEGVQLRAAQLREADELEAKLRSSTSKGTTIQLPVVVFDALLPNQRLEGSTDDPTFCRFLRDLGLGGVFVMISWNPYKRRARRNGVLVRIEFVDSIRTPATRSAETQDPTAIPSSVDFILTGQLPCRVVGPDQAMTARVGHWRREYDSDGEQHLLGWGIERFLDVQLPPAASGAAAALPANADAEDAPAAPESPSTEWSSSDVACLPIGDSDERDASDDTVALAGSLLPLLDKWFFLASDAGTYNKQQAQSVCVWCVCVCACMPVRARRSRYIECTWKRERSNKESR